mgnify:FL=1
MRLALVVLAMALSAGRLHSDYLEAGGMRVSWVHHEHEVEFLVSAPTEGWVAVGFNKVDDIVGAELIMARILRGNSHAEHRYVVAPGDHRPVSTLGRPSMLRGAVGLISEARVHFTFRLQRPADSGQGVGLRPGERLYLIVAYSVSSDFDHHSRVRRHLEVVL